jgi:hypothetical protein
VDLSPILGPGVAGLLFLAFVNTMPARLPYSWGELPAWLYQWLHDGLKTFTSMRGPAPKKDS